MKKNNTKNFIWNAIGLTLNSFNSLFFLIVVRYCNGLSTAGIFTYSFALCALFYIAAIYFNRSFQVSDDKNKFAFSDYFTCRIITSVLSLIIIFIFALINNLGFFETSIIMLLMLFRIAEAISDCFYGAIHKKDHLYQTGISLSLKAVLGLAAFTATDYLTHDLSFALATLVLVNIIIFFIYDLRNYRKLYAKKLTINFKNLKTILKTCFPVFIFSLLALYLSNCQKYIMPYFETNEAQTIFGILIMPATIIGLVGSYLINPFLGTLTLHHSKKKYSDFIKLSQKIILFLAGIGLLATIVCYFIGIPVLNFIYHLDLDAYRLSLAIAIIAATFYAVSMVISNLLTVLEENRRQTHLYIIVAIFATIISILLIQSFGINGAIYAFLSSSILLTILYFTLLQFKLHRLKYGR